MHENNEGTAGALPVLRPGLECIPVRSDPRRVSVSEMYEEDPELEESYEQQPTLFEVMEKICRIVECVTCGGMIYVLARMAGIA